MKRILGVALILFGSPVWSFAEPMLYETQGRINYAGAAYENFYGSLVMSEPDIEFYGPTDSRGLYQTSFVISDFELSSDSYSLSGSGGAWLWWAGDPLRIASMDSVIYFFTSGGEVSTWGFNDWAYHVGAEGWDGAFGAQPTSFGLMGLTIGIEGNPDRYRIETMTARQVGSVPEPSSLLMFGTGLAATVLSVRKRRG